jgi:hypothetical protein
LNTFTVENEPELGWNEWTSHIRCLRWIFWWLK